MEAVKSFFLSNLKWIIITIFVIGVNVGSFQLSLSSKADKEEVLQIAKEEVMEKSAVIESDMRHLKETVDEVKVMQTEMRKDIKELLKK